MYTNILNFNTIYMQHYTTNTSNKFTSYLQLFEHYIFFTYKFVLLKMVTKIL